MGNIDGEIDFYQSTGIAPGWEHYGDWDKSGSIKQAKKHLIDLPWCKFKQGRRIKCKKLDTWTQENNINFIDFVWADVQGAEEDLILGGLNTLQNKTKYFYTEFSNDESYAGQINLETINKLLQGFSQVRIIENNVLLINNRFSCP